MSHNPPTEAESHKTPSTPAPLLLSVSRSPAQLLPRFADELTALGGNAVVCSQTELAGNILDLLRARSIHRIMAWDAACLPGDLPNALENAGIEVTAAPDPTIRAGLTGALAGTADTGTLVLPGGPGQPLVPSLLPEIHIAVLRAGDIKENLAQVFSDENPYLRKVLEASAVALVTGPSRTADIEMTLTIGVHGPGEVHVFCLTED